MKKILLICFIILCGISAQADFVFGDAPFINTWSVLGVFQDNVGIDNDLIGETGIFPKVGDVTNGKKWEYFDDRLFSRNYDDYADLYSYYTVKKNDPINVSLAYAGVYVFSPDVKNVQLRYGADRYSKVFLNGSEIARNEVGRVKTESEYKFLMNTSTSYWKELYDVTTKDAYKINVTLNKGWNFILVKVGTLRAGNMGFYMRLSDEKGNMIPGLVYSVNGDKVPLSIDNDRLAVDTETNMPVAYKEWPYVQFRQSDDYYKFAENIKYQGRYENGCSADAFRFTASGGSAPYTWTYSGKLPKGVVFKNGELSGRVADAAELGKYDFKVTVKDNDGNSVSKDFRILLKERPNKWVEKARLTGLLHEPNSLDPAIFDDLAKTIKAEGYSLIFPISYNNGNYKFRFSSRKYNVLPERDTWDVVTPLKKALLDHGIHFGMYCGNVLASPQFSVEQAVDFYNEMIDNYAPEALWLDWAGMDHPSTDQMFSLMKTKNPDIVIFLNGYEKATNGDWDVLSFEDLNTFSNPENIWGRWPYEDFLYELGYVYNWPKQFSLETWRCPRVASEEHPIVPEWKEFLKMVIADNSCGAITNLDHSVDLPGADQYKNELHKSIAEWCNPKGLEPLYNAYTNCYPMYDLANDYGYVDISGDGKNIYIIFTENKKGKLGLNPGDDFRVKNLELYAFPGKAVNAVCMNTGEKVNFTQLGKKFNLVTKDLVQDDVATIVKVTLEKPVSYSDSRHDWTNYEKPVKKNGNKAFGKPSKMLHPDGKTLVVPSGEIYYALLGNDGVMSSRTVAAWTWNWIYEVDLEKTETISKINIFMDQDRNRDAGYATEFIVSISDDGEKWDDVIHVDNPDGKRDFKFTLEQKAEARYIRVIAVKPDGQGQKGGQMSIAELEVY
ncbi:MAG: discoidin domain-containing protein [Armatimonadetes bacterium]|nr:discoidin domain-containing protein [Candidatus Hippobium faecium]